jgi:hypothetical protein
MFVARTPDARGEPLPARRWLRAVRIAAITFALSPVSCGYSAFTRAMRDGYGVDAASLREVQFYMGDRCVLERQVNQSTGEVVHGRLEVRSGSAIDVVRVPRHTPGLLEFPTPDGLAVSFAPGTFFYFGPDPRQGPGSPYYLLGRYDRTTRRFMVLHAGVEYALVSPEPCALVVRKHESRSRSRDRTTLRGRRLGE